MALFVNSLLSTLKNKNKKASYAMPKDGYKSNQSKNINIAPTQTKITSPARSINVQPLNSPSITPQSNESQSVNQNPVNPSVTTSPSRADLLDPNYSGQGLGSLFGSIKNLFPQRDPNAPMDFEQYQRDQSQKIVDDGLDALQGQLDQSVSAEEVYRQFLQDQLDSGLDPLLTNRFDKSRQLLADKYQTDLADARAAADRSRESVASRFAYKGFGRSSYHTDEQAILAQQANRVENELMNNYNLQLAILDAEERGLGEEFVKDLSNQLMLSNQRVRDLNTQFAQTEAELKLNAQEVGSQAAADMMEQQRLQAEFERKQKKPDYERSSILGYLVDQEGNTILDDNSQPINIQNEIDVNSSEILGYLVDARGNPILDSNGQVQNLPEEELRPEYQFISGTKTQAPGIFNKLTGLFEPIGQALGIGGGGSGGGGIIQAEDINLAKFLANQVNNGQMDINVALERLNSATSTSKNRKEESNLLFLNTVNPSAISGITNLDPLELVEFQTYYPEQYSQIFGNQSVDSIMSSPLRKGRRAG